MTTAITITVIRTMTAIPMGGKRKSVPLLKGLARKRSLQLHLSPPAGRGRSPSGARAPGEGEVPPSQTLSMAPHPARDARHSLPASGERERDVNATALYRLMAWLSPSYPVGAFSYSSGIEWAVEAGDITDAATLKDWLSHMMEKGGGFCDAIFFAHAHRAAAGQDDEKLRSIAELSAAFTPSKERHLETTAQGKAFVDATRAAWPCEALDWLAKSWDGAVTYPVAVGVTAAGHGIALASSLHAFLHALTANWISASVRLVPLGQTDGQRVLAAMEPFVIATAQRALAASLDDLGSAAFRADLASMKHETQYTRLFRS